MHVAIIGLGLIGGSLGKALKGQRELMPPLAQRGHVVTGWDRDPKARMLAVEHGAVDRAPEILADAVAGANLVVVATPVRAMTEVFRSIAPLLGEHAVVTDVGSTKRQVMAWAEALLPEHAFVGGHPMAGSEHAGIEHARSDLFNGATYCLCYDAETTPEGAVELVRRLALTSGARVTTFADPALHDQLMAQVSHLPLLASAALVHVTARDGEFDGLGLLAATGYRDATRLASGDPVMHRDICVTNAQALRPLLLELADVLRDVAGQLEDPAAIGPWLERAKAKRDHWLEWAAYLKTREQDPTREAPKPL